MTPQVPTATPAAAHAVEIHALSRPWAADAPAPLPASSTVSPVEHRGAIWSDACRGGQPTGRLASWEPKTLTAMIDEYRTL